MRNERLTSVIYAKKTREMKMKTQLIHEFQLIFSFTTFSISMHCHNTYKFRVDDFAILRKSCSLKNLHDWIWWANEMNTEMKLGWLPLQLHRLPQFTLWSKSKCESYAVEKRMKIVSFNLRKFDRNSLRNLVIAMGPQNANRLESIWPIDIDDGEVHLKQAITFESGDIGTFALYVCFVIRLNSFAVFLWCDTHQAYWA